jgi:hypothetical protein
LIYIFCFPLWYLLIKHIDREAWYKWCLTYKTYWQRSMIQVMSYLYILYYHCFRNKASQHNTYLLLMDITNSLKIPKR